MREYTTTTGLLRGLVITGASTLFRAIPSLDNLTCKLSSFLLKLDDLLVEDIDSLTSYIQRRMLLVVYTFAIVCISIEQATMTARNHVVGQMVFSGLFVYLAAKINWVLPEFSLSRLKLWGCADILLGFLLNICVNLHNPRAYSLFSICLITTFCYFSASLPANIAVAATGALVSAALAIISGTETGTTPAGALAWSLLLYTFLICLLQAYSVGLVECSKRFMQVRSQAEEQIRTKTIFVACLTHDLKNPLNSLLGFIDLLKGSTSLKQNDKENLMWASCSGQIMRYLIENILDSSKIQIGQFDIERIPMGIMKELKKILSIESAQIRDKRVRLYKKALTPIPRQVFGDSMRFAQVLINIIGNSIKFTSRGYVAVLLKWVSDAADASVSVSANDFSDDQIVPPEEYFNADPNTDKNASCQFPLDEINEDVKETVFQKLVKYVCHCRGGGSKLSESCCLPIVPANSLESAPEEPRVMICRHDCRCATDRSPDEENEAESEEVDASEAELGDSGILTLDVIDTGIGMTEEELAKLFRPFRQGNSSIRGRFGGTGLGLWITKQLVQRMSGLIEVRSQYQKGTRFRVTLPLKIVNRGDGTKSARSARSTHSWEEGKCGSTAAGLGSGPRHPTPSPDMSGNPIRAIFCAINNLRANGFMKFKGSKIVLKGTRVLVVENEKFFDDLLLEQIIDQLRSTDCELLHCFYSTSTKRLSELAFKLDAIIVVSVSAPNETKKLVLQIGQLIKDRNAGPIPIAVTSGLGINNDCEDVARDFQITLPLNEGDIVSLLLKMRGRKKTARLQTIGGGYGRQVKHVMSKCAQSSQEKSYNPCEVVKIMLADDDVFCNFALRNMIEEGGKYQIFPFYNGLDASDFFEERGEEMAVVILDVEMPERNGIETARWIRQFEKGKSRRPVIIVGLTGHEGSKIKGECVEAGMDLVLSKPIKRKDIIRILDGLVKQ